jgi:hypothetical protein
MVVATWNGSVPFGGFGVQVKHCFYVVNQGGNGQDPK